jgi:hypothetical protein
MLYYDVLDDIADGSNIPNEIHPLFHVNAREKWMEIMVELADRDMIDPKTEDLYWWGVNWERVIYQRLSILN